jgi:hemerythrin-like domain-containing protein
LYYINERLFIFISWGGVAMKNQRVRLFREHKYMTSVLSALLESSAKLDFSNPKERTQFKQDYENLKALWKAHGDNEENRMIPMLKAKQSPLWEEMLRQHQDHDLILEQIDNLLISIDNALETKTIHHLGYQLMLELRNYFVVSLKHFEFEERSLMPELQRLYSDDEILELHHISYRMMTPEQMTHMMEVLFPHMNTDDKLFYLNDIRDCQPHKYDEAVAATTPNLLKEALQWVE